MMAVALFVARTLNGVMAGLVPAIHGRSGAAKNVDARDKPGHDDTADAER
ncbi:hypothetical protein [Bradyrhizobium hipponense]|nr:hypothetical protein [Bradyrhizobium hipponense]